MKRTLTAAIAAVVLAACILIPVSADDSSADSPYVCGYVYYTSSATGANVALEGATVYLVTSSGSAVTKVGSDDTDSKGDSKGRFDIPVASLDSSTSYYLGVYCDGYEWSTYPDSYFNYDSKVTYAISESNTITCFLIESLTDSDGDGHYMVTYDMSSASTSMGAIVMMPVTVSLTITVKYGTDLIEDATVTVTNESTGVSYTGKTDESGVFTISQIEYGTYLIEIEADGFETYNSETHDDATVTISQVVNSYTYNLTETEHATYLWGLDLAHMFMICGVVFGLIIALIALVLYHRGNKIEE